MGIRHLAGLCAHLLDGDVVIGVALSPTAQ
jgi:hypothetical protein